MQICRGKIRKAKLQYKIWLGRNRKGNDIAPWEEKQGEGQGCATAQWEVTAFRCTTEINQNVKWFFFFQPSPKEMLCIFTSAKLMMFIKGDLGKAVVTEYTLFTVTK